MTTSLRLGGGGHHTDKVAQGDTETVLRPVIRAPAPRRRRFADGELAKPVAGSFWTGRSGAGDESVRGGRPGRSGFTGAAGDGVGQASRT